VMHTCYTPGRVKYGSRALSRSAIQSRAKDFLIDLHFCAGNSNQSLLIKVKIRYNKKTQ